MSTYLLTYLLLNKKRKKRERKEMVEFKVE